MTLFASIFTKDEPRPRPKGRGIRAWFVGKESAPPTQRISSPPSSPPQAAVVSAANSDKKLVRNTEEEKHAVRDTVPVKTAPATEMASTARMPSAVSSFTLIRPHTTEKTALLADTGAYVFAVGQDANKHTVASAVEARYGVKVECVRMSRTHEKMRRRGRQVGWKPGIKKAIVQLAAGNKIETL